MSGTKPTPFLVLISRQQYLTCHIKVNDVDLPIAAIAIGKDFYSYFRIIPKSHEVFKFILRLSYRGDRFVVTLAPKGYVLWLYEPQAQMVHHRPQQLTKLVGLAPLPPTHFLISLRQCQLEDLQIPGMKDPLPGLTYADRAFSLLEIEANTNVILEMVGRLGAQHHETIILVLKTEEESNFAICVHEPEAELVNSAIVSTRFLTSWGFQF
jgi:hypothetical protein